MTRNEWFRDWFDETYLELYSHRDLPEARRFIVHLAQHYAAEAADGVIDLGCGAGRHAIVMACEYGWRVTGVDLSPEMLRRARDGMENTCTDASGQVGRFSPVLADMRALPFTDAGFSLAVNLFTSFGYFDSDEENETAFVEMVRVLQPGGVLFLDHTNRMHLLEHLVPYEEDICNDYTVHQRRTFDHARNRMVKEIEFREEQVTVRTVRESVRIYQPGELEDLARKTGLEVETWAGDYRFSPYDPKLSPRMILVARKP